MGWIRPRGPSQPTRVILDGFASFSKSLAVTIEDAWGGDIVTAAIAHLAHSTPDELLFTAPDFNSYVTVSTADHAPRRIDGRMRAPDLPGLGIEPRGGILGNSVGEWS